MTTHILHFFPRWRRPRTACGIKLSAYYPQSGKALPASDDVVIQVTSKRDEADCAECKAEGH